MAYQKLQPERAYVIPSSENFSISLDNPFLNIKQKLKSASDDFSFSVSSSNLTGITMLKNIPTYLFSILPSVSLSSTGTGGVTGLTAGTDSNGNLSFTFSTSTGTWSAADTVTITMSAYTIIPSARLQPFLIYNTNNGVTSLTNVVSAALDTIGALSLGATSLLPIQLSSLSTESSKPIVALW